ncbi:MAG: transcription antitermination factor NusB [Acidimicrobiia bacterium]
MRNVGLEQVLAELPAAPDPYAVELVRGVAAQREELDAELGKFSEHWAVDRMPAVDRAILRIGCYELEQGELPAPVVISEAVELAKQYSTKDSGRFVNGLLARIADERGKLPT